MKIVVIGGTGLIGTQLVARLGALGHEAVAASPKTGVDTITGAGLAEALAGCDIVVDVANSPSFADAAVLAFFETSGRNLLAAEAAAGVRHHVALSVVGTERLLGSGYFRGKMAQERLIEAGAVPYTIVRATQFFEFMGGIAHMSAQDGIVHLSSAAMQPIASADVATALAEIALGEPVGGIVEIAGPEKAPLADFVTHWLETQGDARAIAVDPSAPYFGTVLDDRSLVPDAGARILPTRFADWLAGSLVPA